MGVVGSADAIRDAPGWTAKQDLDQMVAIAPEGAPPPPDGGSIMKHPLPIHSPPTPNPDVPSAVRGN